MSRSASAGVMSTGVARVRRRFSWAMSAPPLSNWEWISATTEPDNMPGPGILQAVIRTRLPANQCQYPADSRSFRSVRERQFRSIMRELVEELGRAGQGGEVSFAQCTHLAGEDADAPGSTGFQELFAAAGGVDADEASVVRVGHTGDESHLLECAHEMRHGGGAHLLGGREGAQRDGAA